MTWAKLVTQAVRLHEMGVRRVSLTMVQQPSELKDLAALYPWLHVTNISSGLANGRGVRSTPCFLAEVPGAEPLGAEWSLDTRNHDTGIGLNVLLVRAVMDWLPAPMRQQWAQYLLEASQALNERASGMLQNTAMVQRIAGQLQEVAAMSVAGGDLISNVPYAASAAQLKDVPRWDVGTPEGRVPL